MEESGLFHGTKVNPMAGMTVYIAIIYTQFTRCKPSPNIASGIAGFVNLVFHIIQRLLAFFIFSEGLFASFYDNIKFF